MISWLGDIVLLYNTVDQLLTWWLINGVASLTIIFGWFMPIMTLFMGPSFKWSVPRKMMIAAIFIAGGPVGLSGIVLFLMTGAVFVIFALVVELFLPKKKSRRNSFLNRK